MKMELITALIAFAFASSITPGPNNLMLMTSGANFGFRRTIPHMLGVGIGFVILAIAVGAGLAQVFERFPVTHAALKIGCTLYMLWLALKIAHAAAPGEKDASARPMTFLQAAAFQWINPKAWAMALTAITAYAAPAGGFDAVVAVALVFGAVNLPSISTWTLVGQGLRHWLNDRANLRRFNWTMAALLIASLWPLVMS